MCTSPSLPSPSLLADFNECISIFLAMPIAKVFSNAMAPHRPNMTFTISDLAGLGTGDLAAGRYRIALFGSLEAVPESEVKDVAAAYVRGESRFSIL
jgi:hypothetical protein